ncbi:DME family drug/metabolite transporter [Natronospira proteinivora]|uniref:DME family drug/metabolite transporter n=1 Tax=Natronospira proteinivora TaxID=1807133 RepID=A0ABT1G9N4_9GAMM|nr:DMT family transporter [Natronospira proteinivora]MCP1728031.1 DME family drug/metabolite transporter [Natronospira proteinivora]
MGLKRWRSSGDAGQRLLAGWMVLLAASLWGTAGVASRWIHEAETADAIDIGFWRLGLAVPLLFLVARLQSPLPGTMLKQNGMTLLIMGLCLAGFQVGYFAAIATLGVAVATLLAICTIPVVAALLAWPWYGEAITPWAALALLGAVIGAGLIVTGAESPDLPGTGGLLLGLPLALGASFCFALLTLVSRRMSHSATPLWSATFTLAIAALVLGSFVLLRSGGIPANTGGTWAALAWIALLPTAVAYALFYAGVRLITSATAGMLILAEPLTANVLAWAIHGERLGKLGWSGAALLLSAMALMAWAGRQPRSPK